jgi:hypothetical protein
MPFGQKMRRSSLELTFGNGYERGKSHRFRLVWISSVGELRFEEFQGVQSDKDHFEGVLSEKI